MIGREADHPHRVCDLDEGRDGPTLPVEECDDWLPPSGGPDEIAELEIPH